MSMASVTPNLNCIIIVWIPAYAGMTKWADIFLFWFDIYKLKKLSAIIWL